MHRARAVVFDLDGTLVDTLPDLAAALNRALARHGLDPVADADVRVMVGDGAAKLLERGYAARGRSVTQGDLDAFLEDYNTHVTDAAVPFDGIPALLETFAADSRLLGVCTNKPERAARRLLDHLGLGRFFGALAGGDTYPYRKPDPRHLGAVLAELGVDPGDAVMIGDHRNDIAVAEGVGARAVFARWGYGAEDFAGLGAVVGIDRPGDLLSVIDRSGQG